MTSADRGGPLLEGNRRARILLPIFLVALVLISLQRLVFSDREAVRDYEFRGPTMGTTYLVKVVSTPLAGDITGGIHEEIKDRLARVNRLMSTYDPDSELSRFNRYADTDPFPVSADVVFVVKSARAVSEASEGALDVTVGPLVAAWGFGGSRPANPPDLQELTALRERVGFAKITAADGALAKAHPAMECDLSAVAKGFGVDEVARGLEDLGYHDYLVEVGGEIRVAGYRADGGKWRLAIERPEEDRRTIHDVVEVSGRSMATSGDYRNYREEDGRRVSHLIDPRTGRPITHGLASVSVVHEDCTRADAWATALIVLGPEEGWAVAEREGLAAYFILRDAAAEGGFATRETAAFTSLREIPAGGS